MDRQSLDCAEFPACANFHSARALLELNHVDQIWSKFSESPYREPHTASESM